MALFGIGNRKLVSGNIEIERFLDDSIQANVDVIELLWYKIRSSSPMILGVDVPIVNVKSKGNFVSAIDMKVDWNKGGMLKFYPDRNARCWGYMADTKKNRGVLANLVASGKVSITDGAIKKEIDALITEKKKVINNNPQDNARPKVDVVAEANQRANDLAEQVRQLEEKLKESESQKKPLAGVKIKPQKREEAKEQLSAN